MACRPHLVAALFASAASQARVASASQFSDGAVVTVPFAQAALWAAELPELRLCDGGIDDLETGCPTRPEHGGPGFLSSVFTWRYALNNLRAAITAAASGAGLGTPPEGSAQAVLQLLAALDQLMEQPIIATFGEITNAARQVFDAVKPFLEMQPPAVAMRIPIQSAVVPQWHWTWPSDGRTPIGAAAFTLRTGAKMPAIGFGTWKLWAKEAYQPVRWALEAGYRHIDTAEGYANEAEIGKAIRDSGIPRQELFIATKASSVPKGLTDPSFTLDVFNMQLEQLGTDYVDVYMLHTPPQDEALLRKVWTTLETLYDQGRAKALGISNCDVNDLRTVFSFARVPPAYIQNLFKIYKPGEQMPQTEDIVSLAHANQIAVMGYSVQTSWPHVLPPLSDPHVLAIAKQVGRTPSQVLHRWTLQRGVGVIPKSASQARIVENAKLLDFELNEAAMRLLDGLATLSESGATQTRPAHQEDVYGLAAGTAALTQQGAAAFAAPMETKSATSATDLGPPELLTRTQDKGFPFTAIRDYLLGSAVNVPPGTCQQMCLAEPRCAAWEVCSPVDSRAGCDGCYLIGAAPESTIHVPGWHAAVERRS